MSGGIAKTFQSVPKFFKEVSSELKKVSWTSRSELISSAWVVVVSAFILGIFITITDVILSSIIGKIIN